jgi:FixJ family two-component response regulator
VFRRRLVGVAVDPAGNLVLLIEDDDGMRAALARVLSVAGFDVHHFASAEAFQDAVGAVPPPHAVCLVLDLRLPGISGLELMHWMKARSFGLPVVMMTAFDNATTHEQARQAGAACCLLKPFAGQALLAAVRGAVEAGARAGAP